MSQRMLFVATILSMMSVSAWAQVDRKAKVEKDLTRFRESTTWVYNDLTQATTAAKAANKPLLVVLRCIP
jgi:hypothetical protein